MLRAPSSSSCLIGSHPPNAALARLTLAAAVASAFVVCAPRAAIAHVPLELAPPAPQAARSRQQRDELVRLFEGSPLLQAPPTTLDRASGARRPEQQRGVSNTSGRGRGKEALAVLKDAEASIDAGDLSQAEQSYERVVGDYGDLALSEYARFGLALLSYEKGEASRAIAGLEDEARELRGRAEAHAALAAILYAERPAQLPRAELEFEVASEFDGRYGDADWVARERHWPPKAIAALRRFLALGG